MSIIYYIIITKKRKINLTNDYELERLYYFIFIF